MVPAVERLRHRISAALVTLLACASLAQSAKPAATVDGEAIEWSEVDAILKARPLQFVQLTDADRRAMQQEALDMLIDDLLLQQFLRANGRAVSQSEIGKKLN